LEKCPNLQDLEFQVTSGPTVIRLKPVTNLKSLAVLQEQFESPLFEFFPSLESLEVSMEELGRHSEGQLKEGLSHVKSLVIGHDEDSSFYETPIEPFVMEAIASCKLELLQGYVDFQFEPDFLFRANWPNLQHLTLGGMTISWEALAAICGKFRLLKHLSLVLPFVKNPNLAGLQKLKELEKLQLEVVTDLDIEQVFLTCNALFPLDQDGNDHLTAFPRAQKFYLLFTYGHYLVVKTNISQVQRWICSIKNDESINPIPKRYFRRIYPSHIIGQELPSGMEPYPDLETRYQEIRLQMQRDAELNHADELDHAVELGDVAELENVSEPNDAGDLEPYDTNCCRCC